MEKRIVLALVLSMAVLYGFQWIFPSADPIRPTVSAPDTPAPVPPPPPQTRPTEAPPQGVVTVEDLAPSDVSATAAEDVVVDTTLYAATLSNVGGVLKSFKLKAYSDAEGRPIELVNRTISEKLGWPLAILSDDAALNTDLAKSNFKISRDGLEVAFEFAGSGVYAKKTIEFNPENYELSIASTLTRDANRIPHRIAWRGGFGDQSVPEDPAVKGAVIHTGAKFEILAPNSITGVTERTTAIAGVQDRYFLAAFILPQPATIQTVKEDYTPPDGSTLVSTVGVSAPALDEPIRVYIGPKNDTWLRKADPRLTAVVDYGYFEFITRPLLVALLWIHSYIGNFGWAIIVLTVALNLILFPLRIKQQVSMQKMQKLQPQMKTLQDRYKKLKAADPRRAEVQMEMMNLYKINGVNPMGGCLPLILQMPLLFAFWNMLSVSIELRRAPWILWIRDLSQYDPYYVIPILLAVTMVITQKMTPTTMDPVQAKMMMIMPVMLTAMFLWLQSGVTLYYLTSNVVGIGQQWVIKKYWHPDAVPKKPRVIKNKPIS